MRLRDLLEGVETRALDGDLEIEISSLTSDSRLVTGGSLFVAIPGFLVDGAQFIAAAIVKGAAAVVTESDESARSAAVAARGRAVTIVTVGDARAAVAIAAANLHGRPADRLTLVGVTGTSGKTTTAKMLESIFDASGAPAGLVGTIEYRAGDERLVADRTTPDAVLLHAWFAKMAAAGVRFAVMEVSSHALVLKRTLGIRFAAAVFTNLSRDHFDFHRNFEDYFAAKRMLFDQIDRNRQSGVVNIDDPYGRRLAAGLGSAALTFGCGSDAEVRPREGFRAGVDGLHGVVDTPQGPMNVESPLLGRPNLYNWLGAIAAALAIGIDTSVIELGIRGLQSVRGRFERVGAGTPAVIVDYAHKPDALEKLLHAVRDLGQGRRITILVGCGGDRDQGKRPEMGEIAGRLADFTILTSDNPRSERPEAILDEMERGIARVPSARYTRVTDRRLAIAQAIGGAGDDDVIVIAGKGHETYQVAGDQILHFDDREEAELALRKRDEKVTANFPNSERSEESMEPTR